MINNESYVVKKINLEFFVPAKLEDTLIIRSNKQVSGLKEMLMGNQPRDGGNLILDENEYKNILDVNLNSMVSMSRYAIPAMLENGAGSILNMSSFVAMRSGGFGPSIPYALSKAGVIALTQQMCHDHGPDGIRVNCIAPGHVYTSMVEDRVDQKLRDLRRKAAPLQTEGTAWDIAWAALFLSSDEARWISGTTLPVDGGLLTASPISMLDKLTN